MQLPDSIRDKTHLLISSRTGHGKTVFFDPKCEEYSMRLRIAESRGDYRAIMIMNHLRGLSAGLNGKSNVFIPNTRDAETISGHAFTVYVPGIRADLKVTVEGYYRVDKLTIDPGAFEAIQNGENQKPGIYSVSFDNLGEIQVNLQDTVTEIDGRSVAIADGTSKSVKQAVEEVLPKLANITSDTVANSKKFDLFYSPSTGRFGGMVSRNPLSIAKASVCSSLLAKAMLKAKNRGVKDVVWASDYGGSAVLTQALELLARTQPAGSFNNSNHYIKMYKATTHTSSVVPSAKKLGINFDSNITRGQVVYLATNIRRAADPNDQLGWGDVASDINKGVAFGLGAFGAITLVASFGAPAVAAVATGTAMKTAGLWAGGVGGVQYVGGILFDMHKDIKRK